MRKICIVITARPSYSRVKSLLFALKESRNIELQIVITSSAALDKYGATHELVKKDGFTISETIYNVIEAKGLLSAPKTTGMAIIELSSALARLKPDIVLTIADRYETIATAIAASYMNIPLAHLQGGELTGNIDEKVRHAITKLSDYHFVSTEQSYNRVCQLGEDPSRIFNTGCPSIDLAAELKQNQVLDFNPFSKYPGVGSYPELSSNYLVALQHPVTTEVDLSYRHMQITLEALLETQVSVLLFWPNIDSGTDGTSKAIRVFREANPNINFHFFKNMDGLDFLKILKESKGIIGNSSVGIRECSYLGVPAINIGSRQHLRERGNNVIDVEYDFDQITFAIKQILQPNYTCKRSNIYGDGYSGKKIADLLGKVGLTNIKEFNDQ